MKRMILFALFLSYISLWETYALDNGLVLTPPMGWLAWERFRCNIDCKNDPQNCISEKLFTDMADQLLALGLKEVGYNLVNIDDCWMTRSRDANGALVADPVRFPHGIPWLSSYMHTRGLKLGIYEDYGNLTCGGYPGSYGHLQMDAKTFASWEIDMLKLDGCNIDVSLMSKGYPEMERSLNATGRPIIYSCSWPAYLTFDKTPWADVAKSCNLWRLYKDVEDSWSSVYGIIQYWAINQNTLAPLAKPGQWNDPDMLIIGDFSLSYEESKSQFAIWAILAAPLFVSNDLRSLSLESLSILKNTEIIAVNQDAKGIQGRRVSKNNLLEVWARPLVDHSVAVVFFNGRSDGIPFTITTNFTSIGLAVPKVTVRDLYTHKDLGVFTHNFTAKVNPHGVVMVKMTPISA